VVVFGNPSNRIGEPLTALSPLYGSRALDLCNGADPVCSDGNDVPAHSLYVEAGIAVQAAQFAAGRLRVAQVTQLAAGEGWHRNEVDAAIHGMSTAAVDNGFGVYEGAKGPSAQTSL
jgi:Cutinase